MDKVMYLLFRPNEEPTGRIEVPGMFQLARPTPVIQAKGGHRRTTSEAHSSSYPHA